MTTAAPVHTVGDGCPGGHALDRTLACPACRHVRRPYAQPGDRCRVNVGAYSPYGYPDDPAALCLCVCVWPVVVGEPF